MDDRTLERLCSDLSSNKIRTRKDTCDILSEDLPKKSTLQFLQNSRTDWWQKILNSLLNCVFIDFAKQTSKSSTFQSADLLAQFFRLAVKHSRSLDYRRVFRSIVDCLRDSSKKALQFTFLKILCESFLINAHVRISLEEVEWKMLFRVLKSDLQNEESTDQIKCLTLVLKVGPVCSLPATILRKEFDFIINLTQKISSKSPKPQQESIIELIFNFCNYTAKDAPVSCCFLSERIFPTLVDIYEGNPNDDKMKLDLLKLFYLLVTTNNNNIRENHPASDILNWLTWKSCLCSIYDLVFNEVVTNSERICKNELFVNKNGITELQEDFVELFVEVCKQLFDDDVIFEEPPEKKCRREFNINNLIDKIEESKSWPWLNLTYSLIGAYPDIISSNHYLNLLKVLINWQKDCKDSSLIHHIHCAFIVLQKNDLKIERNLVEELWKTVSETIFRLNLNDKNSQRLLQLLVENQFIKSPFLFFFKTQTPDENNLKTILIIFKRFPFLQSDSITKKEVISWILNNPKIFCREETARLLVFLVLKEWPQSCRIEAQKDNDFFEDLKSFYLAVSLEILLICEERNEDKILQGSVCLDRNLLKYLEEFLEDFSEKIEVGNVDDLLNICLLSFNILSLLDQFKLVENCSLKQIFETVAVQLFANLHFQEYKHRNLLKSISYLNSLNNVFMTTSSEFFSQKLRDSITKDFIKEMFMVLNSSNRDKELLNLKKNIMQTLVSYSCLPDFTNETQQQALQALVNFDDDFSDKEVYELAWTLLNSITHCNPRRLSDESLEAIFNIIQKICEKKYYCYDTVVQLLDLFLRFYPIVVKSESSCRENFINILNPFYVKRHSYGPLVSIKLIRCIILLFELEPTSSDLKWNNSEIILNIPEFLTNEYQQVRFEAINALGKFYRISSKFRLLSFYHLQEIIFEKICEKMQIFLLDCEKNEESFSQTTCFLQLFATIITSSNLWIEESLFKILSIVIEKKIDIKHVEKILNLVASKLGFKSALNLLTKYLVGILNRWQGEHFPFEIYKATSMSDLFAKNWKELAGLYLTSQNLSEITLKLKKSTHQLLEESSSILLSFCISQEVANLGSISQNPIYKILSDTLGSKLDEIAQIQIENILLNLIEFVSDENHFRDCFDMQIIFSKSKTINLSVSQFEKCWNFLESLINQSLVDSLLQNPSKIHFLLLQINLKLNQNQTLEDKLRYFHHYSLFSLIFVSQVEGSLETYLIRDLIYSLLHKIKDYKEQPDLSKMSCILLKKILEKAVPKLSKTLREFFLIIVNRLKYVILENCLVSSLCLEILDFLIISHKDLFKLEIEKIDSIPNTSNFSKIHQVYHSIKYDKEVTLEDEILQFLETNKENLEESEYSMTHLRKLLIREKKHLNKMLEKLRTTRGFSEDCKSSCLHRLICVLINFCCSKNDKVRIEAAKCLGEIGPVDLATLILEPERDLPDARMSPFELVLGCLLSLFSKYLIDSNVKLLEVVSLALYKVFEVRDTQKLLQLSDFGFGPINANYFAPFVSDNLKQFKVTINGDYFLQALSNDNLWILQSTQKIWLTNLVVKFLESFEEQDFFQTLIEVAKLKLEFCENLLPLIVYQILCINNATFNNLLSTQIAIFFKNWTPKTEKRSIQTMLEVVRFVRLQSRKALKNWTLDYLELAKAAHFCQAYFTAIFYAELWCQQQIDLEPHCFANSSCTYTKLDLIFEKMDESGRNLLQGILRQAYKALGEKDAIWGCGNFHLLNPSLRVEHYEELGRWDQVTQFYEREISLGRDCHQLLISSLKNTNFYQLSLFCSDSYKEPNYEALWRLGQWDFNGSDSSHSYDKSKFYALKARHENDEFFPKFLNDARFCIIEDFKNANLESTKNFYSSFSRLQSLNEIEDLGGEIGEVLAKWKVQDEILNNDYEYIEAIQAQRILLLLDNLKAMPENEAIVDTIVDYARFARLEGQSHVAFRILENISRLPFSDNIAAKIKLEEAQLCWSIQDVLTAKCILRKLSSENINPRIHALALKLSGEWMVESSSENRETIIENYFKKSLKLLNSSAKDEKIIIETFDQLARFADHEYMEVMSHIKSDIFQKKKQNIVKARNLVEQIDIQKTSRDNLKAVSIKKKFSCIDESEINNIENEKNYLLSFALKYYLRNLVYTDDYNISVFRVFSLLLENRANDTITEILKKQLLKIPTYKFINILPQIIAHISNSSNIFTVSVNSLIEKCAKDHPYHTLPLILALALSNKDREYSDSKAVNNDPRTQCAITILTDLKKTPKLGALINKMQLVSEAIIELAYLKSQGGQKGRVPAKAKLKKIQNFDDVLLPTANLPFDKSCNYENIVGICEFGDYYYNVGGINAPKRITCKGTDGAVRTQLIKGQDDLRQDAVMQQVFTIMNSLLSLNKQTKNLRIRTYKIVPLSMRSGILEWVDNTIPIGEYLADEDGAHVKFRPMDTTPSRCRSEFKNIANKSNEEKLRVFNKICQDIKPVFHKFFETNFPQATVWYERRRTYILSVATSSMCGYILGIGDRHLSNILIDENTAEVVHIDFGIAFEQGRVLPTPETVPFRLSRDIVDGMGVSGVEGVFRKSCEKTVEVLRLHHQTITTILEVLLYDPLYHWTVSTAEAKKRQKDDDSKSLLDGSPGTQEKNVNETAERALLRLKMKLLGTENGKSTTVTHQVGTLIQQAVNPSNLSKMFQGWQPYL